MSVNTRASEDSVRCVSCGALGQQYEFHHGKYCSNECEHRDMGADLIETIERTSQFCNTCYGQIRDVEPIPSAKLDRKGYTGDGWQYPTELTTVGVDEFRDAFPRLEGTRISCRCGAVNPNETTAELQNIELEACMTNLFRALVWLADREAIPNAPDREAYFASLRDRPRDAALACGKAVYG